MCDNGLVCQVQLQKDYNVKCCFNECVLNFNLCVFSELHTEVSHTTDTVEKRKEYSSFQCKDGTIYKLMGTFVDPKNSKYSDLVYHNEILCRTHLQKIYIC
jgi:hypothetical protein